MQDEPDCKTCVECQAPLTSPDPFAELCELCEARRAETVRQGAAWRRSRAVERFRSGEAVARFHVIDLLGEGGTSDVYRVRDEEGREYALKVANYVPTRPSEHLTLQQNELEMLRRLRHRSLVTVYEGGFLDDGRLYILMEFVEGVRLCDLLIQRGRFDLVEAIRIVRQVLEALAYCHQMGVLHLDLKPNNILVVEPHEPRLKLLDFGLSRLADGWDNRDSLVSAGTPGYMAPECIAGTQGGPGPDERADLYAVGVLLFELLTGRLPFRGAASRHLLAEQLNGQMLRLGDLEVKVPPRLEQLLDSLLARDPALRYPSAMRLSRALRELYYTILSGERGADALPSPEELAPASEQIPFVGRGAELRALERAFSEAVARKESRTMVIVGEPGVGKSRLVAEFLGSLRERAPSLFPYGRCPEIGGLVPYAPFRALLAYLGHVLGGWPRERILRVRAACRARLRPELVVLESLAPELAELIFPGSAESSQVSPSALRTARGHARVERTVEMLASVLSAVAEEVPLVVVIEDLHWADGGTREVMRHLCARRDLGALLLLATTRAPCPLSLPDPAARIALPLLEPAANDELLSALVGQRDPALLHALKQTVPVLSAGIPLFNRQVLRHLEDEGLLRREQGGAIALDPAIHGYQPPDSVPAVLARTLDHLPERALYVLSIAARVGRQCRASQLCGLGLFEPGEVDAAFATAEQRGLCSLRGEVATFVHDAIRAQLGERLPEAERPAVHARLAQQLHAAGAAAGTLAFHLEQSGQPEAAARVHVQAGLEAERLNDPLGACQAFERSVDLLLPLPRAPSLDAVLLEALFQLARVGSALGRHERALELLEQCTARLGAAEAADQPALCASYARVFYVRGDFANALAQSRRCLALCGDDPATRVYQCGPANVLGRALPASGRFGPAIEVLTRGCELAEESHELIELSHSQGLLGVSLAYVGRFAEAERHVQAARELAYSLADPVRVLGGHFYAAALAETRADWRGGLLASAALLSVAEERQIGGLYLYLGTMFAGRHSYHAGHLVRSRVLLSNAINLAQLLHITLGVGWAYAFLGDAWLVAERVDEAVTAYERGWQIAQSGTGDEYALPMCRIGLAHCASRRGAPAAQVIEQADLALTSLRAVDNRCTMLATLERYADALHNVGERARAAEIEREHAVLARELGLESASWRPPGSPQIEAELALRDEPFAPLLERIDPKAKTLSLSQRLAHISGFVPDYVRGTSS